MSDKTHAIDLIKKIAKEYEAQSKTQNKELLLDFMKFMYKDKFHKADKALKLSKNINDFLYQKT